MGRGVRLSEKWFQRGLWIIALIFAGFLTGLGGLIVNDLPRIERTWVIDDVLDMRIILPLRTRLAVLEKARLSSQDELDKQRLLLEAAQRDSALARESFRTWVATRRATTRALEDPEVIKRSHTLDELVLRERTLQRRIEGIDQQVLVVKQERTSLATRLRDLESTAHQQLTTLQRQQELRIFAARLAFSLPLLLLAGWLFLKKRTSVYWPFVWGFCFFALFTFFVELVPYLPSYGGYVRYGVGIVMTFFIGHYATRALSRYLEQQRVAEQQSELLRRALLDDELAQARMAKSVCPGCERPLRVEGDKTNFCAHCGICLFNVCTKCTTRKNAFDRFCPTCGVTGKEDALNKIPA
ncbi:MAG: serine endopeptidase [Ottowia sp.]|nr:serine endopeptidase [Ottowia sp.]